MLGQLLLNKNKITTVFNSKSGHPDSSKHGHSLVGTFVTSIQLFFLEAVQSLPQGRRE
jgi:uncharacterized protein YsxB (DUF464 family)